MTDPEWEAWTLELAASFKGTFGQQDDTDTAGRAQELAYRTHFAEFDYDVMVAAVALLVHDGQVFMPAPGELMSAVRRVLSASSLPFADVWRVFEDAYGRHRDSDPAIVAMIAEACGEGAARWIQARGSAALAREALHDPDHGGKVRHRLEAELATYVEQAQEDRKVGLALQRARGRAALDPGAKRRGLRRVSMGEITTGGRQDGQ